jgi:hypothetical protein
LGIFFWDIWEKKSKNILQIIKSAYLCSPLIILTGVNNWEHSSAGSEHLPYKQGVTGSNPVAPTKIKEREKRKRFTFFYFCGLKQLKR